jgi:hypothetical protein
MEEAVAYFRAKESCSKLPLFRNFLSQLAMDQVANLAFVDH